MTLAIDFDGVIHSYESGWTGYEPCDGPVAGALEFVTELLDAGFEIEVFSARADCPEGHRGITTWLANNGFPALKVAHRKHGKYVAFIDDRAVPFRGDFAATRASLDALLAAPKWWALDSE